MGRDSGIGSVGGTVGWDGTVGSHCTCPVPSHSPMDNGIVLRTSYSPPTLPILCEAANSCDTIMV